MKLASVALLGLWLGALTATPALAQRGGTPGEFDFYVLALSWSSGFCAVEGDSKGRDQCAAGSGIGFTVHGLWPQNERGYPTECGPAGRTPSRAAIELTRGVFPSEQLARHQWRKHGTCSGSSPGDYFRDAKAARDMIVIPAELAKPEKESRWPPIDIERAFVAVNPGLRADMMAVSCRKGVFDEVRICLSKDLRSFRSCQEVDQRGCRAREITAPPVR
ncbi:MAG: ribonuclease T2 [Methylocystis sp.]|nr:ribonuclease T2 [Methylocystis sp.]MCA3582642.1 ribonuclease T2 [Methylocystis sp.]MCA3589506.1 ribonuclease T2 [Methylocystis sp.]MCA3591685.1 ribonuclease T2 [Methylocystis sp.]